MARPYMEPKMRGKMSGNPGNSGNSEGNETHSEGASTIVPKSMLGGKTWKEGDEIVFKIKSIDPETGDAEIVYATNGSSDETKEPADAMSAMDERFPSGESESSGSAY